MITGDLAITQALKRLYRNDFFHHNTATSCLQLIQKILLTYN